MAILYVGLHPHQQRQQHFLQNHLQQFDCVSDWRKCEEGEAILCESSLSLMVLSKRKSISGQGFFLLLLTTANFKVGFSFSRILFEGKGGEGGIRRSALARQFAPLPPPIKGFFLGGGRERGLRFSFCIFLPTLGEPDLFMLCLHVFLPILVVDGASIRFYYFPYQQGTPMAPTLRRTLGGWV